MSNQQNVERMNTKQFSGNTVHGGQAPGQRWNILIPNGRKGEDESLADAVSELMRKNVIFMVGEIMQYNVRYRDYLRQYGFDKLLELMYDEAPALRQDANFIRDIHDYYEMMGPVANYDIQCYDITKPIPVLGRELPFNTLCRNNIEWFLYEGSTGKPNPRRNIHAIENPFGLYLGEVYECYPKFDWSDWCDDRSYRNFIIRTSPIKKSEVIDLMEVEALGNCRRVHENIPEELLPVLYYEGDGNYVLLATKKD